MKYLFVILIVLFACGEPKLHEEILMEGIYDHVDYERFATIIYFADSRAIPILWQYQIDCRKGDSVVVLLCRSGGRNWKEIRIIKHREEK